LGRSGDQIAGHHIAQAIFTYNRNWRTIQVAIDHIGYHRIGYNTVGIIADTPIELLAAAVPARIAGVSEIITIIPSENEKLLLAAATVGIDRVFIADGVTAVHAFSHRHDMVPKVDLLVGGKNPLTYAAKCLSAGLCAIHKGSPDHELLIFADDSADSAIIAADLRAQTSVGEAILLTTSRTLADSILPNIPSETAVFLCESREEGINFINALSPASVELLLTDAYSLIGRISAGCILVGSMTPALLTDYYLALGKDMLTVDDFMKTVPVAAFTETALSTIRSDIKLLSSENCKSAEDVLSSRLGADDFWF